MLAREYSLTRYYVWGSITVGLTSCFICLDSAAFIMLNWQQLYLCGQIQTSQTGGQSYSETCANEVNQHSQLVL